MFTYNSLTRIGGFLLSSLLSLMPRSSRSTICLFSHIPLLVHQHPACARRTYGQHMSKPHIHKTLYWLKCIPKKQWVVGILIGKRLKMIA